MGSEWGPTPFAHHGIQMGSDPISFRFATPASEPATGERDNRVRCVAQRRGAVVAQRARMRVGLLVLIFAIGCGIAGDDTANESFVVGGQPESGYPPVGYLHNAQYSQYPTW